jgi:hypothetical protein
MRQVLAPDCPDKPWTLGDVVHHSKFDPQMAEKGHERRTRSGRGSGACPLSRRKRPLLPFCHGHVGFDRVGNETILVCGMVHLIEFFRTGSSVPAPRDLRA